MNHKEKAERIIDELRNKGFTDDEISAAVVNFLSELSNK
jgi:hypothetical protein